MTRHKIVIATIAVSAMLLYALPAQNLASASFIDDGFENEAEVEAEFGDQDLAQRLVDETQQDIDQRARQNAEQEQEVTAENELEQSNEAEVSQDETNEQSNAIVTGDNTATTTQIGDNDVVGSALAAEATGGSGGDSGNDKCEKYCTDDSSGGSGGSGEASSSIEQEVDNEAATAQDSSADDNVLVNENTFGDDVAIVDQDNVAEQTAVAVGIQEQDQDINQYATNVDLTAQIGEQAQTATAEATQDVTIECVQEDFEDVGFVEQCF